MIYILYEDGNEAELDGEIWDEPEDGLFGFDIKGRERNDHSNLKLIYDYDSQSGAHFCEDYFYTFRFDNGFTEHLEAAKYELNE